MGVWREGASSPPHNASDARACIPMTRSTAKSANSQRDGGGDGVLHGGEHTLARLASATLDECAHAVVLGSSVFCFTTLMERSRRACTSASWRSAACCRASAAAAPVPCEAALMSATHPECLSVIHGPFSFPLSLSLSASSVGGVLGRSVCFLLCFLTRRKKSFTRLSISSAERAAASCSIDCPRFPLDCHFSLPVCGSLGRSRVLAFRCSRAGDKNAREGAIICFSHRRSRPLPCTERPSLL